MLLHRPFYLDDLQPVYENKQTQPHHVNKVPIPSNTFKTKVMFRCEMTLHAANQNDNQHDSSKHHVEAMETS